MNKWVYKLMLTIVRMPTFLLFIIHLLLFIFFTSSVSAQNDSLIAIDPAGKTTTVAKVEKSGNDTLIKKIRVYNPGKAALRSAIVPGLGQIYNKKYWKLPIVYGALGISGGVFVFNLKWYQRTRFAYRILVNKDTARFPEVHEELQLFITRNDPNSLAYARDEYRRRIDYSVLFFALLWGLNVVDAAVDAHLKAFDVSPDLSMQFKPGYSEMAGTSGLSLVFNIGKRKPAMLTSRF